MNTVRVQNSENLVEIAQWIFHKGRITLFAKLLNLQFL